MELFSEIYSCYFAAMRKVLEKARENPLTYNEIADIINKNAYSDSSFYIMPYVSSGEWSLLKKDGHSFFCAKPDGDKLKMPVTNLQKAWIKALLADRRMSLFLDDCEIAELSLLFEGTESLYEVNDFHFFDEAMDGDPYNDEQYGRNFREIVFAIKNKEAVQIEYDSGKGKRSKDIYLPLKLNYSRKDDKFRIIAANVRQSRMSRAILNLSRIKNVTLLPAYDCSHINAENILNKMSFREPIVLQILQGRNALERVLLQFASMKKQTEYDETTDSYTCRIFYDEQDETELLIRILSFGPVVKVLGPEGFLSKIRDRLTIQMELNL